MWEELLLGEDTTALSSVEEEEENESEDEDEDRPEWYYYAKGARTLKVEEECSRRRSNEN